MRVSAKYGLRMRVSAKYGLRMRVSTKYSGEGGDGGKGHDDEGGEGKTQGLLHGNSPFSGSLTLEANNRENYRNYCSARL